MWQVTANGISLTFQSMLRQFGGLGTECFGMDEVALCRWHVDCKRVPSLGCQVAYPILEPFLYEVSDLGG